MTSRDMYPAVQDEHVFRTEVLMQLVRIDGRFAVIEQRMNEMDQRMASIEQNINGLASGYSVLNSRLNDLISWGSIVFSLFTVLVAIAGIFVPLYYSSRRAPETEKTQSTQPDIEELARRVAEILKLEHKRS